jgi:hypothetical protein
VREIPHLQPLIEHISQQHYAKSSNEKTNHRKYQLPIALCYFIKHYQQHYSSLWTAEHMDWAFLPSSYPIQITNRQDNNNNNSADTENQVILSKPADVFIGMCTCEYTYKPPWLLFYIRCQSIVSLIAASSDRSFQGTLSQSIDI